MRKGADLSPYYTVSHEVNGEEIRSSEIKIESYSVECISCNLSPRCRDIVDEISDMLHFSHILKISYRVGRIIYQLITVLFYLVKQIAFRFLIASQMPLLEYSMSLSSGPQILARKG